MLEANLQIASSYEHHIPQCRLAPTSEIPAPVPLSVKKRETVVVNLAKRCMEPRRDDEVVNIQYSRIKQVFA